MGRPLVGYGGVASVGSFFWIYSVRNDDEYDKLLQNAVEMQAQQMQAEDEAELSGPSDTLETGFTELLYGLTALRELVHEYHALRLVVDQPDTTQYLSLTRLPGLSEETFRRGLSVLASGLQMTRTTVRDFVVIVFSMARTITSIVLLIVCIKLYGRVTQVFEQVGRASEDLHDAAEGVRGGIRLAKPQPTFVTP